MINSFFMSKTFLRSFAITLFILGLSAAAFVGGYFFHAYLEDRGAHFSILEEAYQIIRRQGLKPAPGGAAMEYGMIRGMLQVYDDPFTVFVEPAQHELEGNALQGSFGGIGVSLEVDAEGYWVLFPFPDGPAKDAGVQDGDRLLQVDDRTVLPGDSLETVQSMLRGPVGSQVRVVVGRAPDFTPEQISIRRAEIPLPSVTWHLDTTEARMGIIEINLIAASTADEIRRAVADLQVNGAELFVLDLRDNPGGLLTAGVDIARLFLEDGVVMQQQYRDREVETMRVERRGPLSKLPLAVLINRGSASAAEIIAGALKAHGRAVLVGEPSYGKDSVQLVYDLKDGSSLHVTAARWWIPGLEPPLEESGLQPDFPVVLPEGQNASGPDPYLIAAAQALKK